MNRTYFRMTAAAAVAATFLAGCMDQDTMAEGESSAFISRGAADEAVFIRNPRSPKGNGFTMIRGSWSSGENYAIIFQAREENKMTAVCAVKYADKKMKGNLQRRHLRDLRFEIDGNPIMRNFNFIDIHYGDIKVDEKMKCKLTNIPWQPAFKKVGSWSVEDVRNRGYRT